MNKDLDTVISEDVFLKSILRDIDDFDRSPEMAQYVFQLQNTLNMISRFKKWGYEATYFYNIKTKEYSYQLKETEVKKENG